MRTSDKLNPALRQAVQNGLDPSLRNLTVVVALPFLACILIVLHDSGVSFKLLRDLSMVFGDMEPRTSKIQDGKVDGNKFSFATVVETPNGDMTVNYEGTIEGDTLKGTATREGGQARPFEAKRK